MISLLLYYLYIFFYRIRPGSGEFSDGVNFTVAVHITIIIYYLYCVGMILQCLLYILLYTRSRYAKLTHSTCIFVPIYYNSNMDVYTRENSFFFLGSGRPRRNSAEIAHPSSAQSPRRVAFFIRQSFLENPTRWTGKKPSHSSHQPHSPPPSRHAIYY